MGYKCKALLFVILLFAARASSPGQESRQTSEDLPNVVIAVAPNYFPLALLSHTSGEVVVEVKINSLGVVTSADAISGNPLLVGGSRQVARRWKFAVISDQKRIRMARITFVYRLVAKDTPIDQLFPIFKPPYRVEIAHVISEERVSR
jgi:outer membrane biosynthesis protein TonB